MRAQSIKGNGSQAIGLVFVAALVCTCVVAGSIQAYMARSLAIGLTRRLHLPIGTVVSDEGTIRINGLDALGLVILTFTTVLVVALIAWALYNRHPGRGTIACALAFMGILSLSFNTHAVAGIYGIANCVGCSRGDSGWGDAQWDINSAGIFYALALLLTSALLVLLQHLDRADLPLLPSRPPGPWPWY